MVKHTLNGTSKGKKTLVKYKQTLKDIKEHAYYAGFTWPVKSAFQQMDDTNEYDAQNFPNNQQSWHDGLNTYKRLNAAKSLNVAKSINAAESLNVAKSINTAETLKGIQGGKRTRKTRKTKRRKSYRR